MLTLVCPEQGARHLTIRASNGYTAEVLAAAPRQRLLLIRTAAR
jgi:hypothetical protein